MNTLIAYGSKHGSTEECAKILRDKITGDVELYNLKEVKDIDLSKYDKVIIGSSIYIGKIKKEVNEFCLKNLEELKHKKIGLYICCMQDGATADTQLNNAFPKEISNIAFIKEYFGGKFKFKEMNFLEKFAVKMVSKNDKDKAPLDTSKDISTVSNDKINRFVELVNKY